MTIDFNEPLLTISEAAKRFPKRPATVSIWRWSTRGVRGCKLRTVAVGGKRFVPESAIAEFLQACSAVANHEVPERSVPTARTARRRTAAVSRAKAILSRNYQAGH